MGCYSLIPESENDRRDFLGETGFYRVMDILGDFIAISPIKY